MKLIKRAALILTTTAAVLIASATEAFGVIHDMTGGF
jgi:hypothetical protein